MPDVISDSSPLQYLHQAGMLGLLPTLFGQICVPEAVVSELKEGQRRSVPLPALEELSWLKVRAVRDRTLLPLVTHLGEGEKEVLALGLAQPDVLLLLDDRDARRHALAQGLEISGALGVFSMPFGRFWIVSKLCAFGWTPRQRQIVLELATEDT